MIRKDGKIECKFSKKFLANRSLSLTTAGVELAQAPLFKFNRYKRRINVKSHSEILAAEACLLGR